MNINSLDGLRGFACLLVVFAHAGRMGLGAGVMGVQMFFVLNGFLMAYLYNTGNASYEKLVTF